MPKPSKTADLLKVLGQKAPSVEQPAAGPPVQREAPALTSAAPRKAKPKTEYARRSAPPPVRGKAIQFYLHEQDQKLIHELSAWLASQRKRINDSLVMKTVLRAAKTGPALLAAYDEAVKVDGRTRKKHRPEAL